MQKSFLFIAVLAAGLASCHKLDVPITTQLTPSVYPTDSAQFITASGPAYVALRGNYAVEFFFQQTLSTDEAILPARGGNWYDGAQNQQMHYHSWNKDNNYVNTNWTWLATIIGVVNQELSILNADEPSTYSAKQQNLAELKMVRALAYFYMIDNYGNVPIDTVYGDFNAHPTVARAQVFSFLENDIKGCLPYLSRATGTATYGRMNLYSAYALLAKMYLNAQVYTGTARWNDCIAACDTVINSGLYSLAPLSDYLVMFYPTNGPTSLGSENEFIFAIPYDPNLTNNVFPFRAVNIHARYDVPRSEQAKFSLPFDPSAPESTIPSFYDSYFSWDKNDVRNGQWLTGLQYLKDGVTPVTVTTTNLGYNQFYTGGSPSASYTYQVNLSEAVTLRQDSALFDCGNDEIAWNMGYRDIKFYPDWTSTSRNQNNDEPVFRYADILLMKAEAILQGGTATNGQTALSLCNALRAQRTTSPAWTNVTLDSIYNERTREFTQENWHRNDMIRFGKFENAWGFKVDADVNHRIFPIPTTALTLNPNLTQNPGY
ncbi:RagB/SusD family nutrient uptake outer membrane protein [Dinghuibacter silviterrae]|nr:RagB/SusD family nutrient uptake outer membrane protein [Dinghuibacter silviterrae]